MLLPLQGLIPENDSYLLFFLWIVFLYAINVGCFYLGKYMAERKRPGKEKAT